MGKSDDEDDRGDAKKKRKGSSFLGRWAKRLLLVGALGAAALSYGFYQKKGQDGVPQKKLPWQDVEGFKAYAADWWTFTSQKTTEYAGKAKEKWDKEWSKDAEALYEKAAKYVQGGDAASAPTATAAAPAGASGAAGAASAPSPSGSTTRGPGAPSGLAKTPPPPPAPTSSAGYNAYKDAKQAFLDGCEHFRKSKSAGRSELVIANEKFGAAMEGCSRAEELGYDDAHMSDLVRDAAQFRKECRTLLERTK
jgi:hypothetical protein